MQKIILFLLAFFARSIVNFHKPFIIGVTGTVWKTTITSHIRNFLVQEISENDVGYSPYHYNWEYGLPLTIIGAKTGWKNPFKWIWIFLCAGLVFFRKYPRYLVLEYGIDHPGEMDFLLSIAIPDIAILTEVIPNHIEQFGSLENYRKEKLKILEKSKELIVHDSQRQYISREALFYGRGAMSDIDASHIEVVSTGTRALIQSDHHSYQIEIPVFWEFQIENILPLYGICFLLQLPALHIAPYAKTFIPESGRSGILAWKNDSIIIDGSYNGWYLSLHSGIASMRSFLHSHSIVFFLWDMRELGNETETLHVRLTDEVISLFPKESQISFYLVGDSMKRYVAPMLEKVFPTYAFSSSRIAGEHIARVISKKGNPPSMIYVKWSQNTIFLEEWIKKFLASDADISLLCRQSDEWLKKKNTFFSHIENSHK